MKSPTLLAAPLSIFRTGKTRTCVLALLVSLSISAQKKEIRLYDGPAPGSESWHWSEGEAIAGNPMNAKVTFNVTSPSLIVYSPGRPNGVGVIVCPGGSYHVLNTEREGTHISRQLNEIGITVFLFKYRLVRSLTNDPWREMMEARKNSESLQRKMAPLRAMAITDLNRAIRYVRDHSSDFRC